MPDSGEILYRFQTLLIQSECIFESRSILKYGDNVSDCHRIYKQITSTISFSYEGRINEAPPYTTMSLPFWLFILLTSSMRLPVAISVFIH